MDAQVQAAARGDREAMAGIVGEHYATVYRFCARRVGQDNAEDLAQETFLTAHKQIRKFDGRSQLRTWLLGIAHNHCRNLARKRRMEMTFSDVWRESDGNADTPDGKAEGEAVIIDRQALRCALATLSPEHREVVLLHEVEGLSYEEAAEVIGIPVGTVKSRLHHAFNNLRKSLMERAK